MVFAPIAFEIGPVFIGYFDYDQLGNGVNKAKRGRGGLFRCVIGEEARKRVGHACSH